ncbi:hypothetical protein, partial [Endozoicomonas elysicola]
MINGPDNSGGFFQGLKQSLKQTIESAKSLKKRAFGKRLTETESAKSIPEVDQKLESGSKEHANKVIEREVQFANKPSQISHQKEETEHGAASEAEAPLLKNSLEEEYEKDIDSSPLVRIIQHFSEEDLDFCPKYRRDLKSKIKGHRKEIKKLEKEIKKNKHANNTNHIIEAINLNRTLLKKYEKEFKELKSITKNSQIFLLNFFTSLRELRRSNQQENPKSAEKIDRKTKAELRRVVLDSPSGPVELTGLKLRLKLLKFKEQCNHQLPVIGIESLNCHVKYPTEGKKIVESDIDVNDLEIKIQADWGQALHDYVYAENVPKALATLISKIKKAKKTQPLSEIWVKGESIGLGLPLDTIQTLTQALFRQEKTPDAMSAPSPDQLAELITRQLLFPVHMTLEQLTIAGQDGQNKTPVALTASGVTADLSRVTPQAENAGCTPTVDVHALNARATLNPRSGLAPKLISAITQKPELQAFAQTLDQQTTILDLDEAHVNLTQTMVPGPVGDSEEQPLPPLKTQDRQATFQAQRAQLSTVGAQQGGVHLEALHAQIGEDEKKTVTLATRAKTGQLDVTADQLALP